MKMIPNVGVRLSAVAAALTLLGNLPSARAASASWNPLPTNNNWIAAPTTNNWSTGAGTFPGSTSGTSNPDIATFNTNSSITAINCASAFVIGGFVFDSTNASAYTINTSGGTWRINNGGFIRVTGTVTNRQTIAGQLRMATGGTVNLVSDSAIPSATLNITGGIAVNNSASTGSQLILGGTNAGLNILATYTENTAANAIGNLIKTNTGTWVLTGNSTYHSNTFVLGGTLMLMGSGAIPNSANFVVNSGTLTVSNIMSNPNNMWVTNLGALALTNIAPTQSPLTIGTLNASNATFHLGVNGSAPYTDISVSTALNAGPNITLAIDKVVNVTSAQTFTLISYPNSDPDPADFTVTVPFGYSASPVSVGGGTVSVTITPPVSTSLVWFGKVNSTLVSNWDTNKTKNWLDQATMSIPQAYGNPDSVQFDDTAANGLVTVLTTNTPNAFVVNNNTLNYTFNGTGKISGSVGLNKQGNASLMLADNGDDFAGGIVVSGGTVILDNTNGAISGGLTIYGGTTVQIGNNDAYGAVPVGALDDEGTLVFQRANGINVSTSISGGGALTQSGNGTLTLSNTNSYTGVTTVSKGTLALSGVGTISNSASLLVNGATFDVSGIAGTTLLADFNIGNASIFNLSTTNLHTPLIVNSFEVDGISAKNNTINVTTLPAVAQYPATITLIKSANPITLTGGNFNFVLGSLPAASPAYAGTLSESADQTAVQLTLTAGPTGTRSSTTWAGVDNVTATTNWSDALNWQLPGTLTAADNVIFDGTTTVGDYVTINNFLDTSSTVASLTYAQTTSGQWHNTLIPAGTVLTVTGATGIGTGTPVASTTSVTISGLGELDANGAFSLNSVGGANDSHETLDMSGLSTFKNIATSATMALGTVAQQAVTLSLASNSIINVGSLNIEATGGNNGRSGTLNLGATTNTIYASSINVSTGKGGTTKIQFGANAPDGTVAIGGTGGGSARATMLLGNGTSGSAVCNGQLLLAGHLANVMAGTLTLGGVNGSSGNGHAGTVTFDDGTFDVTSIIMGSSVTAHSSVGTFTVGGDVAHTATLTVSAAGGGSLVLGNASISAGTGTGTLNIFANGTANINCSITKNPASGAVNTATINLTDGVLNMMSGTIGTLAAPIDALNLSDNGTSDTKIQLNVVVGVTNIVATAINVSGTTTLNINSVAGITGTTRIPLISYTGSSPMSGLVLGTVPAGYQAASLADSGQTIDLIITPPAPTIWKGAVNNSWDTSTLNWLNGATPTAYADVDFVQFDDSASTGVVTLAATVSPGGLDVNNNVLNYTFNGVGKISGAEGLVKQGSAKLTLDNSGVNDFSGGVNLAGGTLQIGANDANGNLPASGGIINNGSLIFNRIDSNTVANVISGTGTVTQNGTGTNKLAAVNTYSGNTLISAGMLIVTNASSGNSSIGPATAGSVTITGGGTLDIENTAASLLSFTNTTDSGGKQFFIAGAGVGGNGAIVNNGTANQQNAFQYITLTADATVGGPARWDMRVPDGRFQPILDLAGHTLTKTGSNQMSMVALIVTNGGNIIINNGVLSFETISSNDATHITVNAGGVLGHYRENATLFTAPITLNGGMIRDLNGTPGSTNDSPITLTANSFLDLNVGSTDQLRLNGNITESGGSFGLTKTNVGTFSLAGTDTYSGTTLVAQGTLILANNGSISQSKLISVAAGATFDASQRIDQTLALAAGQTLSGFGAVNGLVTTAPGSTVAPGSPTSTGVLTFGSNVALGGTNTMKVTHATVAANDVLNVVNPGTLALGGTLNISLLGSSFAAGDTFTLYSAPGGLSGTFAVTNLPALSGGLGWVTTNLVNGILSIVATVNPNPTNITATLTGNTLNLSWPADHTGWRLLAQTNALGAGLNPATNAWVMVPGSDAVNSESITVDPSKGTVFYRLVYP